MDELPTKKYDRVLGPVDEGIIAFVEESKKTTEIYQLTHTKYRGWNSQKLFEVKTAGKVLHYHSGRIICDDRVYDMKGVQLQKLDRIKHLDFLSMCTLDSEVFVGGYSEHSRFSIYMWVPENKVIKKINPKLVVLEACPNSKKAEYKDVRRPSLKTVGCTKKWHIQLIKPNPHVKNQIFVAARNDIMRVNVEMWKSHYVHPNDIIFRGKSVITDFKLIDNVHLIVMVSSTVYLIDQFLEQPLAIRREIPDLAIQRIILSPSFELDNLPLMIYNGIENEIKTLDIQSTGVTSHILLQRPLSLKAEITPNESGQQAMFIGQDDYNRFRIVTLSLTV